MIRGLALVAGLIVIVLAGCKKQDQTAPTVHKEEAYTPTYNSLDAMDAAPPPANDTYQPAPAVTGNDYNTGEETLAPAGGRTHTVQKGDTLYSLARKYYNNQSRWRDIYNANRDRISNPDKLRIGTELVIP